METVGDGSKPEIKSQTENNDKVTPMDWIKDLEEIVRQLNTIQKTENTQQEAPKEAEESSEND